MEFLQLIEKLADHGKTTCALAQMTLNVMRLAGRADRASPVLILASWKPLEVVLGDEMFLGEGRLADRCEMGVPIGEVAFHCVPFAIFDGAVAGDCRGVDLNHQSVLNIFLSHDSLL
jgi:hypothetical protein